MTPTPQEIADSITLEFAKDGGEVRRPQSVTSIESRIATAISEAEFRGYDKGYLQACKEANWDR